MLLRIKGLLLIACASVCFSCASPNQYAEPIGKLETATNITLEVTKARFSRSLELTREKAYLFAWINKESVRGDFKDENSDAFKASFTPAALNARVALLQELQNFCRLLSRVAGSDVDQQFGTAVQATGAKLAVIAKQLDPKTDIGETVSLLSNVVATIGSAIIEGKREEAIRSAIRDASPHVKRLAELLELDLDDLNKDTTASLKNLVEALANASDAELGKSQPGRLEVLKVFCKYNWERLLQPGLQEAHKKALDELENTYSKLEKFEPQQDISTMLGQIEKFLDSAFSLFTFWEANDDQATN